MPFPLLAMGASALINGIGGMFGASKQADAAERSAQLQADAAKRAAELQNQQYQQTRQDLSPFMQAGQQAIGTLGQRLNSGYYDPTMSAQGGMQYAQGLPQYQQFGIDPMQQYQQASQPLNVNLEQDPGYQYRMQEGTRALEGSAAARGGLFSGKTGKDLATFGQNLASQEYGQAYNRALQGRELQNQAYNQAFNQNLMNQQQGFGQALQSGQFQNQAYNQALQNELAQQQQGYNQLYNMAGIGQQAASQGGQFGQQAAQNIGQYGMGAAQAQGQAGQQAAGAWGGALQNFGNQLTSGLGSYLNYNMMQDYLNR